MAESIDGVLARANATRGAQASIEAEWVWEEKTVAQWDAEIAAAVAQREAAEDAEAGQRNGAGTLDELLEALRVNTIKGLNMAKVKFRNDPAELHTIKGMQVRGSSRAIIMEDALAWESAWEKLAAAWEPVDGMTLASFKTSRLACQTALETYANLKAEWRTLAEQFNELIGQLEDDCIAWYEVATTVFPEGTPEGDMIRGTVPTTYASPTVPLPGPAQITLEGVDPGTYSLSLSAENDDASVTSYEVWEKFDGGAFVKVEEEAPGGTFTRLDLASGEYEVKARARNATGLGPDSDVISVTIP